MKNEKEVFDNLINKYGITGMPYSKQKRVLNDIKLNKELDLEKLEDSFVADDDFTEFVETENKINLEIHNIRVLMKHIKLERNKKIKLKVKALFKAK